MDRFLAALGMTMGALGMTVGALGMIFFQSDSPSCHPEEAEGRRGAYLFKENSNPPSRLKVEFW